MTRERRAVTRPQNGIRRRSSAAPEHEVAGDVAGCAPAAARTSKVRAGPAPDRRRSGRADARGPSARDARDRHTRRRRPRREPDRALTVCPRASSPNETPSAARRGAAGRRRSETTPPPWKGGRPRVPRSFSASSPVCTSADLTCATVHPGAAGGAARPPRRRAARPCSSRRRPPPCAGRSR